MSLESRAERGWQVSVVLIEHNQHRFPLASLSNAADVRIGSKADDALKFHGVRFPPRSGPRDADVARPKCANNRHCAIGSKSTLPLILSAYISGSAGQKSFSV